jgi:dihydrofolate reductase
MWSMKDYAEEQSQGDVSFSSVKNINEYDCKKRQIKQLYVSEHEDSMGEGDIVFINYDPAKWQSVETDSAEESLLKLACDEKSETAPAE